MDISSFKVNIENPRILSMVNVKRLMIHFVKCLFTLKIIISLLQHFFTNISISIIIEDSRKFCLHLYPIFFAKMSPFFKKFQMAKTKRDINFRANVTFDWRGD
jgi:hypothetical protein